MITTGAAPQRTDGTDVNPRCDRCKHSGHRDGKCPNRACGCLHHRDPQAS